MSNDKVREAFEAWARENGFAGFELRCRDDGSYIRTETHDAEAAYAAGRAAGMEEAAVVCEGVNSFNPDDPGETYARAIRALAEGKAPPEGQL